MFGTSPSVLSSDTTRVRTYTAGANSLLSDRLSNEFRLNYTSNYATGNDAIGAFGGSTPTDFAKLVGLNDNSAPGFFFFPSANAAYIYQDPNSAAQRQWNFVDTLDLALGRHQLKFAAPFGEALQQWLRRSPGFNLDKVEAPLMIVGQGPDVLLTMWATYSGLHQLHKPAELVMLNSDEHVLTNPGACAWPPKEAPSTGSASGSKAMKIPRPPKPSSTDVGGN